MEESKGSRRVMQVHTDDILMDPLPQPYRFINKILVKTIEEAIDLAEGGGAAETQNAFVCHNLRLTKVGKIPLQKMADFFLSTDISNQEISVYQIFANTSHLVVGTNQGNIVIFDISTKQVLMNVPVTNLSKFANISPILRIVSFATDHENFVIGFCTEEVAYILFINANYTLKAPIEIDISLFSMDSIVMDKCNQPYLVITDGTGRVCVYDCHTPPELVSTEAPLKSSAPKVISLDPIIELEKCPISVGPVTSESNITLKVEDSTARKKVAKKKPPIPVKNKPRPKSPGSIAIESATMVESTKFFANVFVVDQSILMRFGDFQILLLYTLQPSPSMICDFSLPSPITSAIELCDTGHVALGFENGSFCFLNVKRRTVTGHVFQRRGAIVAMHYNDNILFTFSSTKSVTAYAFDGRKVSHEIFNCSDDDIIQTFLTRKTLLTHNNRPSDIMVAQALTTIVQWEERTLELVPNISFLKGTDGKYFGTLATPANIDLKTVLWSEDTAVFIYNDPKEYLVSTQNRSVLSPHGKRGSSPKGPKSTPPAKKINKQGKTGKKGDDSKDPDPEALVPMKREIIGFLSLKNTYQYFFKSLSANERIASERRELLKSMASMSRFSFDFSQGELEKKMSLDEK